MGIRFGQKLVGESGDSGRVRKAMGSLVEAGMVRRGSSRGAHSHVMDGPGFEVLRRRDRVSAHRRRRSPAHSQMPEERGLAAHEYGVMDLMGGFLDGGLDVAAGWRSWEDMGADGGGIAPDGLVLLRHSPYGPGWHYVEYELRARGVSRVVRKLRGYGSARRRDRWPVLVVVRDEAAERDLPGGWTGGEDPYAHHDGGASQELRRPPGPPLLVHVWSVRVAWLSCAVRICRRSASLSGGSRSMAFRMSWKSLMGLVIGAP